MTRRRLTIAGLAVLASAWALLAVPGLPPMSAHMAAHMAVVALAAPLLAIGLAGSRWDLGRWRAVSPIAASPIAASMVELVVVWVWHAPALHEAAAEHAAVGALEQASFLGAGLLLWMTTLAGAREPDRAPASVAALLTTSMHMTLLGALLTLTPRALYAHPSGCAPVLHPAHDQQVGGAIMIVVGGGAYLAGGLWLTSRLLRRLEAGSRP